MRGPDLGQVAFGTLAVDALGMLGIHPGAAVGYSLGETAALFGMRAWSARDEMLRRVRASSLFSADMAGELRAVRAAWGLGDDAPTPQWRVGVVDRPASAVEAVLTGIDRVYLLIVNTAAECVIGGDPAAVATAVEALGARFHPLRGISAVHCEAVEPVAEAYRALHLLPTAAPPGIRFYSGASGRPYPVDSESAAGAILDSALHGVDFPATVQSAYADGVRVFVETGPGASCTRMIGDILQGDRFAALSVADPARPESENLLRVALGVDAEGYRWDFAPLFARMSESIDITVPRIIDVPRRRPAHPRPRRPPNGDVVIASAHSRELQSRAGRGGLNNLPACYLTGMLAAKESTGQGGKSVVLYIGKDHFTSRVAACMKGIVDGGVNMPVSEESLPQQNRVSRQAHRRICRYLKEDQAEYNSRFSAILKNGLQPEDYPSHFEEIKSKISGKLQKRAPVRRKRAGPERKEEGSTCKRGKEGSKGKEKKSPRRRGKGRKEGKKRRRLREARARRNESLFTVTTAASRVEASHHTWHAWFWQARSLNGPNL